MPELSVAFVMTSFEPGGTERQMIGLLRGLAARGWRVCLACTRAKGAWFGRAADAASSVAEFPLTSFRRPDTLVRVRELARWLGRQRVSVVHTTDLYSNIFGLPAAAMAGVPARIANRREINPDKSFGHIALQRACYAFADRVVANSRAAADRLAAEWVPSRRVRIVPNGVELRAEGERPPRTRVRRVVVVANLRPEKGHDVLIDAAPRVLARYPDAHFDIVGDGPERDALRERVARRRVQGAFTFHGHCDTVAARLADADLFVLPSRSEAFPNALLEALAAGVPAVATAVGGIREMIDHEETGLLVPPDAPAALAGAICRLMEDPPLAARLGARARVHTRAQYSFDRMITGFEQVYLDAVAS